MFFRGREEIHIHSARMLNLLKLKQEKADAKAAGGEGDGVSAFTLLYGGKV
jgi:hypothetical protein